MAKTKDDPEAVDRYLAAVPEADRHALQSLRAQIEQLVPDVQERISYGTTVIFALRRDLVGMVAQDKHLSFFTMSPPLTKAMGDEIKRTNRVSGATIHFSPDNPLPSPLVERIVRARLDEESAKGT